MTLRQITDRMRLIICQSLNGDMHAADAFRHVRMLERLRLSVATTHYEDRLELLEQRAGLQGGRVRGRMNGQYETPVGYDDSDDLDERGALQ